MSAEKPIAILTYHSLDDSGSVLATPPALFEEQMAALHESGTAVVSLEGIPDDGAPAAGGVVITFDDGFRSIFSPLMTACERYRWPVTVFLVTDYCGRDNGWPGQPDTIPRQPLLGWDEVRELARAGVRFGSHTRSHPDLTRSGPGGVEDELRGSKERIEDALGVPVTSLAFPYGRHSTEVREVARRHYRRACDTTLDYAGPASDPLALERLDMYYLQDPRRLSRLFTAGTRSYMAFRRNLRRLRGWAREALDA